MTSAPSNIQEREEESHRRETQEQVLELERHHSLHNPMKCVIDQENTPYDKCPARISCLSQEVYSLNVS